MAALQQAQALLLVLPEPARLPIIVAEAAAPAVMRVDAPRASVVPQLAPVWLVPPVQQLPTTMARTILDQVSPATKALVALPPPVSLVQASAAPCQVPLVLPIPLACIRAVAQPAQACLMTTRRPA